MAEDAADRASVAHPSRSALSIVVTARWTPSDRNLDVELRRGDLLRSSVRVARRQIFLADVESASSLKASPIFAFTESKAESFAPFNSSM